MTGEFLRLTVSATGPVEDLTLGQIVLLLDDMGEVLEEFWQMLAPLEGRLESQRTSLGDAPLEHMDAALGDLAIGRDTVMVAYHLIGRTTGALRDIEQGHVQ